MRTTVLATVAAMAATSAMAETTLGATGLTLNTEAEAQYKVDAETTTVKLTPELGYAFYGVDLSAATTLELYDNASGFTLDDEFNHMPTIDFGAVYMVRDDLELDLSTSYDFETESRGDVVLTATFAF